MSEEEASQKYHKGKNNLFFAGVFLDLIVLPFLFYSGFSIQLKEAAAGISSQMLIHNGIYITIFSLCLFALHLPLKFYGGYLWEHKFQLSNQNARQWAKDELIKAGIGFIVILFLVEAAYVLLGLFEADWWLGAGVFWLFVSFVLAKLTPTVIVPLFFKYSALENRELKEKIFKLFKDCRTPLKDIYAIDLSSKTKKANAFLCGVGQNRRVVLSDTLLNEFTDEEIEVVVAHELAHYKHKDIIKLLSVNAGVIFLGLYLIDKFLRYIVSSHQASGLDDISLLPLLTLAFMVFGFCMTPLLNGYTRLIEREADRFSLEKTNKTREFVSLMEKLAKTNLAQYIPGRLEEWFFYDHPPVHKRIAFARQFKPS